MENMETRRGSFPPELARYAKQMLCDVIGLEGQRRLRDSAVLLIGCGALGTNLAETLVRAGIGRLKICDRDFIEEDNLPRQVLFDEDDLAQRLPKAEAAARKLRRIDSSVAVEAVVADVHAGNIERLAAGAHLILDGADNFETRYLINDLAVQSNRPWVYGAVIGVTGLVMTIIPGVTPCLRCVFDQPPPSDMNPTCDTAGVLSPAVGIVAAMQAAEAIKICAGRSSEVIRTLLSIDVWSGRFVNLHVGDGPRPDCRCCQMRSWDYLEGRSGSCTVSLCGRNAVQIDPRRGDLIDLSAFSSGLAPTARSIIANEFLVRAELDDCEITLFPDGRAIVKGTDDPVRARSLYAKYVGL